MERGDGRLGRPTVEVIAGTFMLRRMAKVRVPLWQQPNKYAVLDPSPAIVGVNVFLPDSSPPARRPSAASR